MDLLEAIRKHFGTPVLISSGYRCEEHNRRVGGAVNSQHLLGTAADLNVVGFSPTEVQEYLKDHEGGLGIYKHFTHVDVRKQKARWNG